MRDEVEAAIKEFGWTKAAMDNMVKVDSFLRESLRMNGLSYRKAPLSSARPRVLRGPSS
jgi:hypothetical protein